MDPMHISFQEQVQPWLTKCFGTVIASDKVERNHRFLEESLELVQATGCTQSEAHQLVDYVFNRPVGEPAQEVGGVMVTLAALCLANRLDMHEAGKIELDRVWKKIDVIRAAAWCYAEATAALLHHQDQVQVPPGARKRIYVAGPYTQGDPEENVRKAVFAADAVAELGFAPFVPHLSHLWEQISPKPYAFWIALDNAFLPLCDALLRIPGPSSGADGEVALALSLGIPVFHSLEALAAALQP